MRVMAALGIGASLICVFGCGSVMAMEHFTSIPASPWSIGAARKGPRCFVAKTPDNDWRTTSCLPDGGFDPLLEAFAIGPFFTLITVSPTEGTGNEP